MACGWKLSGSTLGENSQISIAQAPGTENKGLDAQEELWALKPPVGIRELQAGGV